MLWELGSEMALQYFNAWNTCVKLAWQVPRASHTYFIDHLLSCGLSSVRRDTLARYTRFARNLIASPSMAVAVMCWVAKHDIRTVTGSNIALIRWETGLDPVWSSLGKVKVQLLKNVASVPDTDRWRLKYLSRLLTERGEAFYRANDEEVVQLSSLIDSLCV